MKIYDTTHQLTLCLFKQENTKSDHMLQFYAKYISSGKLERRYTFLISVVLNYLEINIAFHHPNRNTINKGDKYMKIKGKMQAIYTKPTKT